jgi:curved DNA-binding protein CbpA
MSIKDYYSILKVSRTSTLEEIKESYKRLALFNHPDKVLMNNSEKSTEEINKLTSDATENFQIILEAYTVLTDTAKKQEYDKEYEKKYGRPPSTRAQKRKSTVNVDDYFIYTVTGHTVDNNKPKKLKDNGYYAIKKILNLNSFKD